MNKFILLVFLTILFKNAYCQNDEIIKQKTFHQSEKINFKKFDLWLKNKITDSLFSYNIIETTIDELNIKHIKLQQTYNQIEIENAILIVHCINNFVNSINGTFYTKTPTNNFDILTNTSAFNYIDDKSIVIIENNLPQSKQEFLNKRNKKLKYIISNDNLLNLCYVFEIKNNNSNEHLHIYINSFNGKIERKINLNHCISKEIEVNTIYSGKQKITVDSSNQIFTLIDSTRGLGIETVTLNNQTNLSLSKSITDTNINFLSLKSEIDKNALDVHFGAIATYDFYLNKYNRNSIDNKGYKLKNYVHYGQNFANAYWDGNQMIYGDGDTKTKPLTSIDIIGHEITHGLTANTAKLISENESGALNESFSDIFGVLIDFYARPNSANWTVGEQVSNSIRSLADPSVNNDPKTYMGTNWKPVGGADFGGIHSNNGVQNYWFYLLVNGGKGINDKKDSFDIKGIGLEKASKIVYRNLIYYITPLSEYNDARLGSIQATIDLFGNCSNELESVTNAWYAVGVGSKYLNYNKANFNLSFDHGCDSLTIITDNTSQNSNSFKWIFGDGEISNDFAPKHTYNKPGIYEIKLISYGDSLCGLKDSTTWKNNIIINQSDSIISINSITSCNIPNKYTPEILSKNIRNWYSLNNLLIDTTQYFNFNKDTIVYFIDNHQRVGMKNSSKNTNFYNSNVRHMIFDVHSPLIIESVEVNAQSDGFRNIELRDNKGNVLKTKNINIKQGVSRIYLNFRVDPGIDYQIGIGGNNIGLSRSSSEVSYPYKINEIITIKRSNALNAGYDYYYFFYDWDIKGIECQTYKNYVNFIQLKDSLPYTVLQTQKDTIIAEFNINESTKTRWFNCTKNQLLEDSNSSFLIPGNNDYYALISTGQKCFISDTTECISINKTNINLQNQSSTFIYPNPTNNILLIKSDIDYLNYQIVDISGKSIVESNIENSIINLENINSGVYILSLYSENYTFKTKLIKL